MPEKTTQVTVSTVDTIFFSGEASSVTVPGEDGEMTVLPHHSSVITPLRVGTITVRSSAGEETFPVTKGICEISDNQVTILL